MHPVVDNIRKIINDSWRDNPRWNTEAFPRHDLIMMKPPFSYPRAWYWNDLTVVIQCFKVSDAIWYGAEERAEADFTINLGAMRIGWPELYVGIMTVITVYPVTLLVIEMFRRRRDPDLTVGTCTDTFCGLFYFSLLFTFVIPNILQK